MSTQAPEAPDLLALRAEVIAALTDAGAKPMTLDEIKSSEPRPDYYTEVTVAVRFGGSARTNGQLGTTGYRISTRAVAKVETTAYQEQTLADRGLRNARLNVNDVPTTPVLFESGDDIAEDDGEWSALTTWTTTRKNRRAT